ncbi:hypothetical protein HDV05_002794 [Chytridiales sp. JEL 0842]|nr:hypothetical protein HDV05_002794 [Chytridiales sp. JEL 0842]
MHFSALSLLALVGAAMAQTSSSTSTTPTATTPAATTATTTTGTLIIPTGTNQVMTIIRPFTNTVVRQNDVMLVTWTFAANGVPASVGTDLINFQLTDIARGPNVGRPVATFGTAQLQALSLNVTIPANATNGAYAIGGIVKGTYFSSPPFFIGAAPTSTFPTTTATTGTSSGTAAPTLTTTTTSSSKRTAPGSYLMAFLPSLLVFFF